MQWFYTVDPLLEKRSYFSPYIFSGNNPLIFVDPDGQDYFYFNDQGQMVKYIETQGATKIFIQNGKGFKEAKINFNNNDFKKMWDKSNPYSEKQDVRKEQAGVVVLNLKKFSVDLIKDDDKDNTYKESDIPKPAKVNENSTFLDKEGSQLILFAIHTHPNKDMQQALSGLDKTVRNVIKAPMYSIGHNYLDKVYNDSKFYFKPFSKRLFNGQFPILKDAIKTKFIEK